ncbi:hypothetical protein [Paenibacillus radicis (ex Xue et al. 2023)]|uniref:Uncharacterized protein n=1 Tax=Paenibacillus radicis (ex Xue et al. 2023) TaxID=2972489 RepID=A0ABT1YCP0_9BACL|nr:hypothetical protein [Paenibacillus radicis (ex Xue et al. 2023)]MCR8630702.1 hypothetical protein [Paenibacillus radicis (ex Xue et al. 2023)]
MSTEIPYQQAAANYQNPYSQQASVMSVKDWILTFIVTAIPVVNIIMLFIWAFGDSANPNKKNYSKATLLLAAILIVIYALFFVLFVVILGAGLSGITSEL